MPITVNPKYKEHPTIINFEQWVKEHYTGQVMPEIPSDVDLNEVFYYKIDGKQYGPIPYKKVPKKFK